MLLTPESAPPHYQRHPMGLPPGSVRAILTLLIAGLFWLLLLLPEDKYVRIPLYLYALLGMVFVFFAAHGHSIGPEGTKPPLNLPRGSFRALLILGFALAVGWQFYSNRELLLERLTPDQDELPQWPQLVLALGGGFGLGRLSRLGPWRRTAWYQDLLAWLALLSMIGLGINLVIEVFIKPNIEETLNLVALESVLVGIIAYYYGARS